MLNVKTKKKEKKIFNPQLALLSRLSDEVLARRAEHRSDPESLKLCAALLEHNPEVYTAWNWRREVVGPLLDDKGGGEKEEAETSTSSSTAVSSSASDREKARLAAAQAELDLTEKSLRRNPKCYSAWHHRRWVLLGRPLLRHLLRPELALVDRLLDADARNFHAWAHRRAVAAVAGVAPEEAERAAMRRVEDNFSNYSAWHERSATLLLEEAKKEEAKKEKKDNGGENNGEFDLVRQAVFTDPEDQAPWLYHRWLLSQSVERFRRRRASSSRRTRGEAEARGGGGDDESTTSAAAAAGAAAEALSATLEAETAACEELLEAEPDRSKCKWPLLTLARLSEARAWLERERAGGGGGGATEDGGGAGGIRAPPLGSPRPPPSPSSSSWPSWTRCGGISTATRLRAGHSSFEKGRIFFSCKNSFSRNK